MHILLIEPDRVLAETYCQALRHYGHSVAPCASAQSAVLVADRKKPDVVVLEIQLVEHSGIEFLYEFRSYQDWRDIPVIVHSSIPPQEFAGSWKLLKERLGVVQYMYKPHTNLRQLHEAIEKYSMVTL